MPDPTKSLPEAINALSQALDGRIPKFDVASHEGFTRLIVHVDGLIVFQALFTTAEALEFAHEIVTTTVGEETEAVNGAARSTEFGSGPAE